jgi:hypothetical protein
VLAADGNDYRDARDLDRDKGLAARRFDEADLAGNA